MIDEFSPMEIIHRLDKLNEKLTKDLQEKKQANNKLTKYLHLLYLVRVYHIIYINTIII